MWANTPLKDPRRPAARGDPRGSAPRAFIRSFIGTLQTGGGPPPLLLRHTHARCHLLTM